MHHERHPRRTKVTTTARMHQATNRSPAPHSRGRPPRSRPAPPLPPRAEPTTGATNARRSTPTAYRIDRSGTHAPRSGTAPARYPEQRATTAQSPRAASRRRVQNRPPGLRMHRGTASRRTESTRTARMHHGTPRPCAGDRAVDPCALRGRAHHATPAHSRPCRTDHPGHRCTAWNGHTAYRIDRNGTHAPQREAPRRRAAPGSAPQPGADPTERPARASGFLLLVEGGEDLVGGVEVGVDVLDVVAVLEGVDEAHDLAGTLEVDLDLHRGQELRLGGVVVDARLLEGGADGDEVAGLADDLEALAEVVDLLGAGVEDGVEHGLLVDA